MTAPLNSRVSDALDDAIECIESKLPEIRAFCRKTKKQKKASDRVSPEAKERLRQLSEEPIVVVEKKPAQALTEPLRADDD